MTNADVATRLASLRADLVAGRVGVDEVGPEFERLTFELGDLRPGDDGRLSDLVNEIELIRFARRPENQRPAIAEVLARAQPLFDELASRFRT
jgi:hypothetical protein